MTLKTPAIGVVALCASTLFIGSMTTSVAQGAFPENSYATNSTYGKKWRCLRGFDLKQETCVKVTIPANAFLRSSGDGWECERGFKQRSKEIEGEFLGRLVLGIEGEDVKVFGATIY